MRILFVCLGNICRSPTAEGVMRSLIAAHGLQERIEVDSAGTGSWHLGSPPDERASAAALRAGIELGGRARQVHARDLDDFDVIAAMDDVNARELRRLARDEQQRRRIRLLREFDPVSAAAGELHVPDPYYGERDGFAEVLELVRAACRGMLEQIMDGRLP